MKIKITAIIIMLALFLSATDAVSARNLQAGKEKNIRDMIEQKSFRFKAQFVRGFGGADGYLTDKSMVLIEQSSLVCYLPDYAGLDFTSDNFEYKWTKHKSKYTVIVKDKSVSEDQFIFQIDKNGYSTLQIVHSNGSGINFRGRIIEV